jgi:recombination protein RecA
LQTVGSQVVVKIVKNKLAPPFKTAQFELEFGKGICREGELIDLGVKHKFFSKSGAFFYYNDQIFRGKDAFKKFLAENESVRDEITVKLREKLLSDETQKEPETEAVNGDLKEEPDSTDEETVTAVEA